jgi:REP element-mobilizing transposase RayT
MKYNPDIHHRRSIRLKGYDYSRAGLYFVTISTYQGLALFGQIVKGEMRLNEAGMITENTWLDLVNHISNIELHEFIVMPNHFHGIIEIRNQFVRAGSKPALQFTQFPSDKLLSWRAGLEPARTEPVRTDKNLSEIVRQFKTFSARRINQSRNLSGTPVWHRNYHEHIIRNETAYLKIADYVETNPQRWQEDRYFQLN